MGGSGLGEMGRLKGKGPQESHLCILSFPLPTFFTLPKFLLFLIQGNDASVGVVMVVRRWGVEGCFQRSGTERRL